MKNKKTMWWIAAVAVLPFIVMLGLHIGIALGNYFHININIPNVDAADWFMFFSSYLGGSMTLVGVMITLQHERRIHNYEKLLEDIEKEKEELGKAICELNLFAPSTLYQRFNSLHLTSEGYNSAEVAAIRQQISEEMQRINAEKIAVMLLTDIYEMTVKCAACKKPCRIQAILPEFQKTYEEVGGKIYNVFQMIDTYVVYCEQNAIYQALINNCHSVNQQCKLLGQPSEYDEAVIKEYESKIVDVKLQQEEINKNIIEICNYNKDKIPQLISFVREYIFIKKQNASKQCFS